ncbi:MAG: PEP-CTERM sorting domain-containing protein [Armatimonadota bacterium]|nr:PEP-CTERM sorting domain-containing protein [Armatimonadota bacterium]
MKNWMSSAAFAAFATANAGAGITSELYLTAGDQGNVWVVQGTGVNRSWVMATGNREYPIAVADEVRTLGGADPDVGAEYTLAGVDTGTRYNFPAGISSAWDGTTDLVNNYLLDFGTGTVYQTGLDWSSPTPLFTVGGGNYLGITYDFSDDTLWVSGWSQGIVEHRSLGGALLGSFATPFSSISCLALDDVTGTLWMGTQAQQGTFFQYSKAGASMGSVFIEELVTQNTLGGEFRAVVPEPATLLVVGVGLLALVSRRRR